MHLGNEELHSSSNTRWSRVQQGLRGLWRGAGGGSGRAGRWALALLVCGALAASRWRPTTPPLPCPVPAADIRVLKEDEARDQAGRRLPSLPLAYWDKHQYEKHNNHCAPYPSMYDLEFHNTYWQTLRTSNGTFHLYGAYLDARAASPLGPAVRVLGVHDRVTAALATHCYLWFDGSDEPVVVRTLEHKNLWRKKWGNYFDNFWHPYLLACVLPREVRHRVPASVSLVKDPYDCATNNLRVHYARPTRKDFAVCVKGLDFHHRDVSVRLIEWIELVLLMGADKIFFYELHVHPNVSKVLEYYAARGAVGVTPLTLPGGQPNLPGLQHLYLENRKKRKRQMELIPYNDCLYRHLYEYRWVVPLDVDEVIVPARDGDWRALLRRVAAPAPGPPRSSYTASYLYFLEPLRRGWQARAPRYMHMLQHVHRAPDFIDPSRVYYNYYFKSIHETERVVALHNHVALECFGGCSAAGVGAARVHHYRASCDAEVRAHCTGRRARTERDLALWRWRDPLVARVDHTLRALAFLP